MTQASRQRRKGQRQRETNSKRKSKAKLAMPRLYQQQQLPLAQHCMGVGNGSLSRADRRGTLGGLGQTTASS